MVQARGSAGEIEASRATRQDVGRGSVDLGVVELRGERRGFPIGTTGGGVGGGRWRREVTRGPWRRLLLLLLLLLHVQRRQATDL